MADDLEKKPQKNNETKKDEKDLKAAASDTPKSVEVSSTKTKELKKDNPKVDKKEEKAKETSSTDAESKKVTTANKKNESNKTINQLS